MDYGYSILMAVFGGAILLFAAVLGITKDMKMLQRRYRVSAKMKDEKLYATQLAKCIALTALAPLASAAVGLFASGLVAAIVLVALLILFLWLSTKIIKIAQ
ncbi:MAG: hypothetical protein IJR60_00055 [Eubacterium sp.]|nr:hypothetical protein [Eubacterium sp.]